MLLHEVFTRVLPWAWNKEESRSGYAEANFGVGNQRYTVTFMEYVGYDEPTEQGDVPGWVVDFGLDTDDYDKRFGINRAGNATTVFATVIDIITDFINQHSGSLDLHFSADEPSRRSLYRAMIKRMGLEKYTSVCGINVEQYTVRIRKKG